jgi:NADH-quinone oxidoreductase subunit N
MWGKIYLFNTAVQQDLLWLVVIGVVNSVVSAYYYFRVAKVMWFSDPESEEAVPSTWPLRLSLLLCTAGVVVVFFVPKLLLEPAQQALDSLMGLG